MSIGDSVLTLSLWKKSSPPSARPAATYVYVKDADATYARALAAGAKCVRAPMDAPYGERTSKVDDVGGNTWFIATITGQKSRATD